MWRRVGFFLKAEGTICAKDGTHEKTDSIFRKRQIFQSI